MIRCKCPFCAAPQAFADNLAGKRIRCAVCGRAGRLPKPRQMATAKSTQTKPLLTAALPAVAEPPHQPIRYEAWQRWLSLPLALLAALFALLLGLSCWAGAARGPVTLCAAAAVLLVGLAMTCGLARVKLQYPLGALFSLLAALLTAAVVDNCDWGKPRLAGSRAEPVRQIHFTGQLSVERPTTTVEPADENTSTPVNQPGEDIAIFRRQLEYEGLLPREPVRQAAPRQLPAQQTNKQCPRCQGHGSVACPGCGGRGASLSGLQPCLTCGGRWFIRCSTCKGSGQVPSWHLGY